MGFPEPKTNTPTPAKKRANIGLFSRRIFLASLVVASSGCQNLVKRGQSPDEDVIETVKPTTKYVASVCKMSGLRDEKIEGIALVTELNGTGSAARPSEIRTRLERELERMDLDLNTDKLIGSEDTEIVLCRSFLPPGVRKGDLIDIEVQNLRDSTGTSLNHGYTLRTRLHDTAKLGNTVREGHLKAVAQGRVITRATFETRDESADELQGVIFGGGRSQIDRNLTLLMRKGSVSVRTATRISSALNKRFTISSGGGLKRVAEAKTDKFVDLKIPEVYRNNVGRYAQVVSNLAFEEDATSLANRIAQLEIDMQDTVAAGLAAVRLEGIGRQAVPALIRSLRNPQLPIQFYAAQALAYIGKDDGVEILRTAAIKEPAFRWQALAALATLDNADSEKALVSLLSEPSAETRYGAFRALRKQNPSHAAVQSQWLGNDHHFCIVGNESEPMLHFSRNDLAEIVIFNDSQTFSDQFLFVQSGLTVKSNGDGTVSVANYRADNNSKTICSDRVSDVFQTVAQSGFGYSTLFRMARQAKKEGTLNARLAIDATPKVGRQYTPNVVQNSSPQVIQDSQVQPASWWSSVKERFAR